MTTVVEESLAEAPEPHQEPAAVEDLDAASTSAAGGMDQEELD